jgi:hypothetical protein
MGATNLGVNCPLLGFPIPKIAHKNLQFEAKVEGNSGSQAKASCQFSGFDFQ